MKGLLSERVVSEERFVTEPEKKICFQACVCTFQPGHFTACCSEGINKIRICSGLSALFFSSFFFLFFFFLSFLSFFLFFFLLSFSKAAFPSTLSSHVGSLEIFAVWSNSISKRSLLSPTSCNASTNNKC